MEYITKDTHLDFSTDDGVTYKELYGLNGYPDMGSEPEQKDVTNMRDSNKRYIAGLTDTGNLGFDFYYNKETAEDSGNLVKKAFAALKEQEGKLLNWKLTYPDRPHYTCTLQPTAYITAGKVGDVISFRLSTTVESTLEYSDGASA